MTETLTATKPRICPTCQHAEHIAAVVAALDPDRLANKVRAELRSWAADAFDVDVIQYGPDRELMVDRATGEVWEAGFNRTADQQMRLALIHLAAALAAGARA